jgi:hypothetical protein
VTSRWHCRVVSTGIVVTLNSQLAAASPRAAAAIARHHPATRAAELTAPAGFRLVAGPGDQTPRDVPSQARYRRAIASCPAPGVRDPAERDAIMRAWLARR